MNTARIVMRMKPRGERPNTAAQIIAQLRPQIVNFPGFRAFVTLPPAFQIGGRSGDNDTTTAEATRAHKEIPSQKNFQKTQIESA